MYLLTAIMLAYSNVANILMTFLKLLLNCLHNSCTFIILSQPKKKKLFRLVFRQISIEIQI